LAIINVPFRESKEVIGGCWFTPANSLDEAAQIAKGDEAAGMMAVPYLAAFYVTRVFLPAMLKRGSGRCVFVTSAASRLVWPGAAGYTAARRALCGLFEAVRGETAGTGVGATMVTFAKVRSDYWANNPGSEERVPKAQAAIPVLSVEQAARAILKGLEMDKEEVIEPTALRLFLTWNHWYPAASRKMMARLSLIGF